MALLLPPEHDVRASPDRLEESRSIRHRVLTVAVHHHHDLARRVRERRLRGDRVSLVAVVVHDRDAPVRGRERFRDLAGPVAASIVDDQDPPVQGVDRRKCRHRLGHGPGDRALFVVREEGASESRLLLSGHRSPSPPPPPSPSRSGESTDRRSGEPAWDFRPRLSGRRAGRTAQRRGRRKAPSMRASGRRGWRWSRAPRCRPATAW